MDKEEVAHVLVSEKAVVIRLEDYLVVQTPDGSTVAMSKTLAKAVGKELVAMAEIPNIPNSVEQRPVGV